MKKLFLVAAIALGLSVNAQEKSSGLQGIWWVAGDVSFDTSKTGDAKTSSSTILPIVGYFVSPDVTIGLGVGTKNAKTVNGLGVTSSDLNLLIVKPLVRKYWNISGGLFFYGQAALPIVTGKEKISEGKLSSFGLEFSPGFDYVVNKWLTVETSFSLFSVGSTTSTPKTGNKTTDFSFSAKPMSSIDDREIGKLQVGVKFLF